MTARAHRPPARIGLIAGNGRFPVLLAAAVREQGGEVVVVAHRGETPPGIAEIGYPVTWIRVGEIGRMIATLKDARVTEAVMAGGITKAPLFSDFAPDERGQAFLAKLPNFRDDVVLRALAAEIEQEGIRVVDSTLYLRSLVAPTGCMATRPPSEAERADVRVGYRVAKAIGRWDVGQSVVVRDGTVVAVEGIEGTDATIRRAAALTGGPLVVVKVAKPHQDPRFDLPAVGPETVAAIAAAGGGVLAVEARKTLLLDRRALVESARRSDVAVVGVTRKWLQGA